MRHKFLMILLFFLFMAAVPVGFAVLNAEKSASSFLPKASAEEETAIARTAALCHANFSDEAIRAVAIVQRTNLATGEQTAVERPDISDKDLLERVARIYRKNHKILTLDGKAVFVPSCACSNGFTENSATYDYLCAVASPWDCRSAEYDSAAHCEGVSINGLSVLTDWNLPAEEALQWYLPRLKVTETA